MNNKTIVVVFLILVTIVLGGIAIALGTQMSEAPVDDVSTVAGGGDGCDVDNPSIYGSWIYIPTSAEDSDCTGSTENLYQIARHWGDAYDKDGNGVIDDKDCQVSNDNPEHYYTGPGVKNYAVPPDLYGGDIYCGHCVQIDLSTENQLNKDLGILGNFGTAQYGGPCPAAPLLTINKKIVDAAGNNSDKTTYKVGENIYFEIKVSNTGEANFDTIRFRDKWDATYLEYVSGTIRYNRKNMTTGVLTGTDDNLVASDLNAVDTINIGDVADRFGYNNFRPGENFKVRLTFKAKAPTSTPTVNKAIADDRGDITVTDEVEVTIVNASSNIVTCGTACNGTTSLCQSGYTCDGGKCKLDACVSNPDSCKAGLCALKTIANCGDTCDGTNTVCRTGHSCDSGTCKLDECIADSSLCQANMCYLLDDEIVDCGETCGGNLKCSQDHQCVEGVCVLNECADDPSLCAENKCEIAELPDTAILSEEMDRVIIAIILMIGGVLIIRFNTTVGIFNFFTKSVPNFIEEGEVNMWKRKKGKFEQGVKDRE